MRLANVYMAAMIFVGVTGAGRLWAADINGVVLLVSGFIHAIAWVVQLINDSDARRLEERAQGVGNDHA